MSNILHLLSSRAYGSRARNCALARMKSFAHQQHNPSSSSLCSKPGPDPLPPAHIDLGPLIGNSHGFCTCTGGMCGVQIGEPATGVVPERRWTRKRFPPFPRTGRSHAVASASNTSRGERTAYLSTIKPGCIQPKQLRPPDPHLPSPPSSTPRLTKSQRRDWPRHVSLRGGGYCRGKTSNWGRGGVDAFQTWRRIDGFIVGEGLEGNLWT